MELYIDNERVVFAYGNYLNKSFIVFTNVIYEFSSNLIFCAKTKTYNHKVQNCHILKFFKCNIYDTSYYKRSFTIIFK